MSLPHLFPSYLPSLAPSLPNNHSSGCTSFIRDSSHPLVHLPAERKNHAKSHQNPIFIFYFFEFPPSKILDAATSSSSHDPLPLHLLSLNRLISHHNRSPLASDASSFAAVTSLPALHRGIAVTTRSSRSLLYLWPSLTVARSLASISPPPSIIFFNDSLSRTCVSEKFDTCCVRVYRSMLDTTWKFHY